MTFNLPISCEWLITNRCNMSCHFCSSESNTGDELVYTDKHLDAISQNIKKSGCLYVGLSGGEPLLSEQFYQIASHLQFSKFVLTLTTNGTLIDKSVAQDLKGLGFGWVQMSLLSPYESKHNNIMGQNSYKKILNAIEYIKVQDIGITLSYIDIEDTSAKIEMELLARRLGVQLVVRQMLTVGRASNQSNGCVRDRIEDYSIRRHGAFAILPNGDLKTCSESKFVYGNVFVQDIKTLWQSECGFGKCLKSKSHCLAELSCIDPAFANNILQNNGIA